MPEQEKQEKKLALTDTPNVAQVIRIFRELERESRWHRRLGRWFRRLVAPAAKEQEGATVTSIADASVARKRFDADGRVMVETDLPYGTSPLEKEINDKFARHRDADR